MTQPTTSLFANKFITSPNQNSASTLNSLKMQREQTQQQASIFQSDVTSARAEQQTLTTQQTSGQTNLLEVIDNTAQLQENITTASESVSNASAKINTANNAVSSATANVQSAQAALAAAQSIPETKTTDEEGNETTDTSARDAAVAAAQAQLAQAQAELSSAQAELSSAQAEFETAQAESDTLKNEMEELQQALEEAQMEVDESEQNLEESQQQLDELDAQIAQAEAQQEQEEQEAEEDSNQEAVSDKEEKAQYDPKELIMGISETDKEELTKNANILLNPDGYSDEDKEKAKKYVDEIKNKPYNAQDEDVAKFMKIAQNVGTDNLNTDEEKQNEVKEDIASLAKSINLNNGVSKETINALELALQEIGVSEDLDAFGQGHNTGEMLKYGGNPGDAWCVSFVSWLYGKGQNNDNSDTFGYQINVSNLAQIAKQAGHYSDKQDYQNPVAGDLMIQGGAHIGMVVNSDDNYVYTIEGNAGDKVRAKKYSKTGSAYNKITGYVKMNEWNGSNAAPNSTAYMAKIKFEDADNNLRQSTL